jgi:hypothetical protein
MGLIRLLAVAVIASVTLTGPALAQSKAPPQRSAASLECSRQADEKGLHGKARKHFRSKCLKAEKRRT